MQISEVVAGDYIIIAFTRPAANSAPVFAEDSYSRTVSEAASIGSNVGDAITATDADDDTLSYALSGTNAAHFSVSATGQITVASALDYAATPSYALTLTATDGDGATDTAAVNIAVTEDDPTHCAGAGYGPDRHGGAWNRGCHADLGRSGRRRQRHHPLRVRHLLHRLHIGGHMDNHGRHDRVLCRNRPYQLWPAAPVLGAGRQQPTERGRPPPPSPPRRAVRLARPPA